MLLSYRTIIGIAVLFGSLAGRVMAQQPTAVPDPQMQAQQQQKSMQYLRIEYERCRQDLTEIWVKGDLAEQRVKGLEAEVQKLTNELATLKGNAGAKPAN